MHAQISRPTLFGRDAQSFDAGVDKMLAAMVAHPFLTLGACLLWSVLKAGLWLVPSIHHILHIAQDVRHVMVPDGLHWLYGSFLGPVLAHVLGLSAHPLLFAALNLSIIVAAFVLCGAAIRQRYGAEHCVLYALLFAAAPISNPLFNWLGYADAVTFAMFTAIVITNSASLVFLFGLLMTWNHFEQSTVFLVIYVLFAYGAGSLHRDRAKLIALAAAIVSAKLALSAYFAAEHMTLHMSRFTYSVDRPGRLSHLMHNFLSNPLVLAWSLFSGVWLYVWQFYRNSAVPRAIKKATLMAFVICTPPVLLVTDATRVFAMLSWPVLLLTLTTIEPAWWAERRRAVVGSLLVAALIPQIMVWNGWIYSSATLHSVYFAKRYVVNGEHEITPERVSKPFVNNSAVLNPRRS